MAHLYLQLLQKTQVFQVRYLYIKELLLNWTLIQMQQWFLIQIYLGLLQLGQVAFCIGTLQGMGCKNGLLPMELYNLVPVKSLGGQRVILMIQEEIGRASCRERV